MIIHDDPLKKPKLQVHRGDGVKALCDGESEARWGRWRWWRWDWTFEWLWIHDPILFKAMQFLITTCLWKFLHKLLNIQVDEVVVPQGDVSANSASGWEDSPGRAPRLPMIRFFQESTDNFQDDIADFLHKCRIVGGQRGITIMEDDRGRCCLLSMGDCAESAAMKWWSISSP